MFRTSERLQSYQKIQFPLDNIIDTNVANGNSQKKDGYKFTINDRSTLYDFYNGYFEFDMELQKKADGAGYRAADRITIINGSHSLIKNLMIKSSGKKVYESLNVHRITNVKNLLEYSDTYAKTAAKNSFWYLDTSASTANSNTGFESRRALTQAVNNDGTGGSKTVTGKIPLNRYSFFEELENKMLPPMQLQFELTLNDDDELIHKGVAVDPGRVVVTRLVLWVPKMTPKYSLYNEFVSNFLKPTKWVYMKELYSQSQNTRIVENSFQISAAIDNVKHVFVYLQRTSGPNNEESARTPYVFDTFKLNATDNNCSLTGCRLEYGSKSFPETRYDANSKARMFARDLLTYAYRVNDYNTGPQVDPINFNSIFGLVYFDLTYQEETVTRDPKPLNFKYHVEYSSNSRRVSTCGCVL